MRPKIKFLIVVWGEFYIKRLFALGFPSFLAPGNLPALAEGTELEVVVMMRERDIQQFAHAPAFEHVRKICSLRFIPIDDLIATGVYGVTLTLAFGRAVIGCGEDMLRTHFVFMNADFVLADGSLRALLKHIRNGRSVVLGPSFRATSEALQPLLMRLVNEAQGTLVVSQRELAAMALQHPHPSTAAKVVNQRFMHSREPSQFFWQVDEHTLLGRYFLIFMLCLKPERVLKSINTYSDYGFIPEMCPSGDEAVMSDSDEFFMLELQHRQHETIKLRLGAQTEPEIAKSLQAWTTTEHRRAAKYDVVFHAGGLSPQVEMARAQASAFISRIEKRLRSPVPHAFHPHWVGGIIAFARMRAIQGLPVAIPELQGMPSPLKPRLFLRVVRHGAQQKVQSWLAALGRSIWGRRPQVNILHPAWSDYAHLRRALSDIATPDGNVLLVRERAELTDALLASSWRVQPITFSEFLHTGSDSSPDRRFTHVFVYLQPHDLKKLRRVMRRCQSLLDLGAKACYLFVHDPHGPIDEGQLFRLAEYAKELAGWPVQAQPVSFVGGRFKHLSQRLLARGTHDVVRFNVLAIPWALPGVLAGVAMALWSNLFIYRNSPRPRMVKHCSSLLILANGSVNARAAATSLREIPCSTQSVANPS